MKTEEEIREMLRDVKRDLDENPLSAEFKGWNGMLDALKWVLGD